MGERDRQVYRRVHKNCSIVNKHEQQGDNNWYFKCEETIGYKSISRVKSSDTWHFVFHMNNVKWTQVERELNTFQVNVSREDEDVVWVAEWDDW